MLDELLNIKNAAEPDNYLHLVTGAAALYLGTIGAGRPLLMTSMAAHRPMH